ncbi:lipopolysaccharide-induced tumor necrosis factor-alpha factor-like [Aricia agestis]|uniref:lipopolysaccharide-induced tumor necrosis factor-alpha factor-like n=1 Tax=Aricia agestis TaxID=91739 RepID=UPI001C20B332|nr:lipopolysaccharide-induced tumor necrosis factor-alpha factor-like [Aricia agestis]
MSSVPVVGPKPSQVTCPSCKSSIMSKVKHKPTTKTHLIALLLCLCLCWPCVCVPYCVDSCRNADHYCPSCNAYIGTYQS